VRIVMARRKPGKRVDYITLDVDGKHHEVEFRASTGMHSEALYLYNEELGLEMAGTDLKVLKQKAKDFLEAKFSVKWEKWVELSIGGEERGNMEEYELALSWCVFEQGIDHEGGKLSRDFGRIRNLGQFWRSEKYADSHTYVRHTPELVKALEDIGRAIDELREKLSELLSPKLIDDTIRKVTEGAIKLLPPVATEKGRKTSG